MFIFVIISVFLQIHGHLARHNPGERGTCLLPGTPKNVAYSVVGSSSSPKPGTLVPKLTVLEYSCNVGYILTGNNTAVCHHGRWSTGPPQCTRAQKDKDKREPGKSQIICETHCTLPEQPIHGHYDVLGSHLHHVGSAVSNDTVLHYTCEPGFKPVPTSTSVCQNGKWIGKFEKCEVSLNCILPEHPRFGSYSIMDSTEEGTPGEEVPQWTIIKYKCKNIGIHDHNHAAVCRKGSWSPPPPKCEATECNVPNCPQELRCTIFGSGGSTADYKVLPDWTVVEYSCKPPLTIVGSSSTVCHRGNWSQEAPTCEKSNKCILPRHPRHGNYNIITTSTSNIKAVPGSLVPATSTLYYRCHDSYVLRGRQVISCVEGDWQGHLPKCIEWSSDNSEDDEEDGSSEDEDEDSDEDDDSESDEEEE